MKRLPWVRNVLQGGRAKRLKLGQVVTATGAKRLEDGCETTWGGGGVGKTSMVRNVLKPTPTSLRLMSWHLMSLPGEPGQFHLLPYFHLKIATSHKHSPQGHTRGYMKLVHAA